MLRSLIHDENPLIGEQARLFLRDTYDHALQVSEAVDMCREAVTGLMNSYISAVGHRTNEVMKVLTIMSSIFVPLTFMAGIYGMNFEHMPELQLPWAYPLVWVTMLGCVAAMLFFFRRKGWIGNGRAHASLGPTADRHAATVAPRRSRARISLPNRSSRWQRSSYAAPRRKGTFVQLQTCVTVVAGREDWHGADAADGRYSLIVAPHAVRRTG